MGLILSTILPGLLRDLAGLCGVGFVSYGAWLVYPPAGFIVGGSLMIAGAVLLALGSRPVHAESSIHWREGRDRAG